MSEGELSFSAVRQKRAQQCPTNRVSGRAAHYDSFEPHDSFAPEHAHEQKPQRKYDPWRMAAALKERWRWLAIGASALGATAFIIGYFRADFHSHVTLIPHESANQTSTASAKEGFQSRQFTSQTLISLMGSPELAERVASKVQPPVSAARLRRNAVIGQVADTELVALYLAGKDRSALVALANLYANEAVELGKELQASESRGLAEFYNEQLAGLEKDLIVANEEFVAFQGIEKMADPDAERQAYIKQLGEIMSRADNLRIEIAMAELQVNALQTEIGQQNPIAQKLQAAKNKLTDSLTRLTEEHPFIKNQRREIAELEKQATMSTANAIDAARLTEGSIANTLYMRLMDTQTKKSAWQKELQELDKLKGELQGKVTGLSDKALRYANLKARLDALQQSRATLVARQSQIQLFQKNAQGYYRVFAPAALAGIDSAARWKGGIKAALAGLILGFLGAGLVVVGSEVVDGRLKTAADLERVTGLPVLASLGDLKKMSPAEQEAWAFRTWTAIAGQLNASPNRGMVCGFISSSSGEGCSTWVNLLVNAANKRGLRAGVMAARNVGPAATESDASAPDNSTAMVPAAVSVGAEGLMAPVRAHIPLPGSVWSLEHRKEWQNALGRWRGMENLVVLVDLPPASVSEAVLLAENIPQVIWLADSGKARVRATREQLKTLRHAKCRIVGAVLNHEPKPVFELDL